MAFALEEQMKDRGIIKSWGRQVVGFVAALSIIVLAGAPAQAKEYKVGKEGTFAFDSTLTLAASMRTEDRDCNLIAPVNGGCNSVEGDPIASSTMNGRILNSDDGNLNVDKWDVYSIKATMMHEMQYDWRNIGAFARVNYFFDLVQDNNLGGGFPPQRTELASAARYRTDTVFEGGVVGRGFMVLDLYGYSTFNFANRFWDLRLGNQVVTWGEEYFAQGGIKATNALDVTKLRTAGSELKEGLLPAPMIRLQGDIIGNFGFDTYYQFYWNKTEVDPTGTFYSVSDMVARGAQGQFIGEDPGTGNYTADELLSFGLTNLFAQGVGGIPRLDDVDPSSQGQYGISLKYYSGAIGTEFAGYYLRFHDKLPTLSFVGDGLEAGEAAYFVEYLEDLDVYGASFNTVLGGIAFAGEVSYRPNQPIPIANAYQKALGSPLIGGSGGWVRGEFAATRNAVQETRIMTIFNGLYVVGPATPVLGPVNNFLGSDDMNIVGEVSVASYPDLDPHNVAYAGPLGIPSGENFVTGVQFPYFVPDENSWGYTIRLGSNYSRAFGSPITLSPSLTFKHDVSGTTPDSGVTFTEDRMAIAAQLTADYQKTWKGILTYANSFGAGKSNVNNDRDFLQLSISYAF